MFSRNCAQKINTIFVSKTISFPLIDVYGAISDVESYEKVLPYVKKSKIFFVGNNFVKADMRVALGIIDFSYQCNVLFDPYESISIESTKGPFTKLNVHWEFSSLNAKTTAVSCKIEYKFKFFFPEKIAMRLVESNMASTIQLFEDYLRNK